MACVSERRDPSPCSPCSVPAALTSCSNSCSQELAPLLFHSHGPGWDLHRPSCPSSLWPISMLWAGIGAPGGSQGLWQICLRWPLASPVARLGLCSCPGRLVASLWVSHLWDTGILCCAAGRDGDVSGADAFFRRTQGAGSRWVAWSCLALILRHVNIRGYFLPLPPPSLSPSLSFSQQRSA